MCNFMKFKDLSQHLGLKNEVFINMKSRSKGGIFVFTMVVGVRLRVAPRLQPLRRTLTFVLKKF